MARIAGVDLPRTKRIEIGLTYIYGIGRKRSNDILGAAGVSPDVRVKDLSEEDARQISRALEDVGGGDGGGRQGEPGDLRAREAGRLRWWPRAPPEPPGARPAHQDQRAYPEGAAQGCDRQE